MDTSKKNVAVEEATACSDGTEENKKGKGYLKSIYLENIKNYRNLKWTLDLNFNVLSGGKFMDTSESTTTPILRLIHMVCEERSEGFSDYVNQNNKPAAFILEEVDENDIVSHHGLFSWLGSDYIFSKKEERLEYKQKKKGCFYQVELNDDKKHWKDNTDRMILCLLISTTVESETNNRDFSQKPLTKCVIEDQCPKQLADGDITLFFRKIKVIGGKPYHNSDVYKEYETTVEYCSSLENEISSTHGPVVTGVWTDELFVEKFLQKLKDMAKERGVQVLLVTDKLYLKQNCLDAPESKRKDWQMFCTKNLYDQKLNNVGIIPLFTRGKISKPPDYDKDICQAELIVHVEGKEDEYIIKAVMDILAEQLEEPSERLDMKKYSSQEREALRLMLKNTHINCLNGKGNAKNIKKFLRLPIPSVVVLDKDALFVECSAVNVNDDHILKVFVIKDEHVAPPIRLMDAIYKKPRNFHGAYKRLNDLGNASSSRKRFSTALKICMEDDLKLNIASYKRILKDYGHIFVWEGRNGTSSDAFGLDKGQVIRRAVDIAEHIKNKMKTTTEENDNIFWNNLASFKDFLFEHTFTYYTNFYEELFKALDPNVSTERLTYRKDINKPDVGHLSISYVPTTEMGVIPMNGILEESLEETAQKIEANKNLISALNEDEETDTMMETKREEDTVQREREPQNYPFHDIRCTETICTHKRTGMD